MNPSAELKPCPFCGAEAIIKIGDSEVTINCSLCGLHKYSREEYEFAKANYSNILKMGASK